MRIARIATPDGETGHATVENGQFCLLEGNLFGDWRPGATRVGLPRDPEVRMGPLVHPGRIETVMGAVHDGVEQGASLLCGGHGASGIGRELGKQGMLALTRTKNVMISLFPNGFRWY